MTNPEILKKHLPEYKQALTYHQRNMVYAALEEAREDERNQGRGKGPVWVKATEEVPKDQLYKHIKIEGTKCVGNYSKHHDGWINESGDLFPNDQVEWLKEPDNK